jgi:hypothetical protein
MLSYLPELQDDLFVIESYKEYVERTCLFDIMVEAATTAATPEINDKQQTTQTDDEGPSLVQDPNKQKEKNEKKFSSIENILKTLHDWIAECITKISEKIQEILKGSNNEFVVAEGNSIAATFRVTKRNSAAQATVNGIKNTLYKIRTSNSHPVSTDPNSQPEPAMNNEITISLEETEKNFNIYASENGIPNTLKEKPYDISNLCNSLISGLTEANKTTESLMANLNKNLGSNELSPISTALNKIKKFVSFILKDITLALNLNGNDTKNNVILQGRLLSRQGGKYPVIAAQSNNIAFSKCDVNAKEIKRKFGYDVFIVVNQEFFPKLQEQTKRFTLLHEENHCRDMDAGRKTNNNEAELNCDRYAIKTMGIKDSKTLRRIYDDLIKAYRSMGRNFTSQFDSRYKVLSKELAA